MDGISYNLAGAKEVSEKMVEGLQAIATEVENQWPTLISTFQKNWVGEDEAAFENVLAKTIQEVYENCDIVVRNASVFMIKAAQALYSFQQKIAGEMDPTMAVSSAPSLETLESDNYMVRRPNGQIIAIQVSPQTFSDSTQRGLQSNGAAQELMNAIKSFADAVKKKIEEIYGEIDLGTSFVGSEQRPAMQGFIQSLGENASKLLGVVDAFINDTIPELEKAYQRQQTQVSEDAASASSSIADEVSSATGN